MSKDFEILTIGDDEPAVLGAGLGSAPDANCFTLPVAPDPCMHTPDASLSLLAAAAAVSPQIQRLVDDAGARDMARPTGWPVRPGDEPLYPQPALPGAPVDPEGVEYDIVMPGGGVETVKAGQLEGTPDTYLKAQLHLQKLKMLKVLMKRQRRRLKLEEAKPNRVEKSRKKRDAQKASRKKNRGK
jgi:hypothetical protein